MDNAVVTTDDDDVYYHIGERLSSKVQLLSDSCNGPATVHSCCQKIINKRRVLARFATLLLVQTAVLIGESVGVFAISTGITQHTRWQVQDTCTSSSPAGGTCHDESVLIGAIFHRPAKFFAHAMTAATGL